MKKRAGLLGIVVFGLGMFLGLGCNSDGTGGTTAVFSHAGFDFSAGFRASKPGT